MKRFPRWRRLRSTMARSASPRERKVMRASPFSLPSVLRCSCMHSGVTWSAEKVESVGFSNAIDAESQDSKQWGKTKCEELYKSRASSQVLTLPYRMINRCLLLLTCLVLFIYVITLVPQRNQGQHHFFFLRLCVCALIRAYSFSGSCLLSYIRYTTRIFHRPAIQPISLWEASDHKMIPERNQQSRMSQWTSNFM